MLRWESSPCVSGLMGQGSNPRRLGPGRTASGWLVARSDIDDTHFDDDAHRIRLNAERSQPEKHERLLGRFELAPDLSGALPDRQADLAEEDIEPGVWGAPGACHEHAVTGDGHLDVQTKAQQVEKQLPAIGHGAEACPQADHVAVWV